MKNLKKLSVQCALEIASRYSYKVEVVVISRIGKGRAFLSLSNNFLKSPYPHHFTSSIVTLDYINRIMGDVN